MSKELLMVIFINLSFIGISFGEGLKIGTEAPFFRVISGDDKELTLDMIKGKVIVMFYETKDVIEKNRRLKDELNKFYNEQPEAIKDLIVRLPIVDCTGVFFKGIWKSKLKKHSKKEGMTIYGDWDGKMKSSYKIKDKESNFVIIDKKGMIRYFTSGKIDDKDISEIKELLRRIVDEK